MSDVIEDGRGRGYKLSISSKQRANVSSKSNPRIYYNSRDGDAFSFFSQYTAADGDIVLYIRNDNQAKNLILTSVTAGADVAATWTLTKVAGTGSGTSITGSQLNFTKNKVAEATALGNAAVTGLSVETSFGAMKTPATSSGSSSLSDSIILGKNDAIAIKFNAASSAEVVIFISGHYESHSEGVV